MRFIQGAALHKDEILDRLAQQGNVVQFLTFQSDDKAALQQSYSGIAGHEPIELFFDAREAISALLSASSEQRVNVRSYMPNEPRSRDLRMASIKSMMLWLP